MSRERDPQAGQADSHTSRLSEGQFTQLDGHIGILLASQICPPPGGQRDSQLARWIPSQIDNSHIVRPFNTQIPQSAARLTTRQIGGPPDRWTNSTKSPTTQNPHFGRQIAVPPDGKTIRSTPRQST